MSLWNYTPCVNIQNIRSIFDLCLGLCLPRLSLHFTDLLLLSFPVKVVGGRGHVAIIVAVVVATHRLLLLVVLGPNDPLDRLSEVERA